ncbi:hypothetical protein AB0F72_04285 [Actinoplanes sp. NPDC023936]|uniref:hypothetical protein n=1 Tax=Actinoplanes sp. NPDC023936 TaxID=3154910 RepID=UPI0033CFDAE1
MHARVFLVTAIAEPEKPIAARDDPPTFDEVYAAHYTDLAVQLYAYGRVLLATDPQGRRPARSAR